MPRPTKTGKFPFPIFAGFFATLLMAATAWASIDVTATVDRDVLGPEDTLTYTVSVNSSEEVSSGQPTLPDLADFEILNSWTSQEARASFVSTPSGPQFRTLRTIRYNYMFQPKREGSLRIGSSEVVVDGKTFNTKPISIRSAKGASGSQAGRGQQPSRPQLPPGFDDEEDDVFSQLLRRGAPPSVGTRTLPINPDEAFFIQVETDKTEAYVNEQITVSWYLYTRGQIRDLDTLKYPSLRGFWKEDIEIATHLNFTTEVVNGIPYKKALLASFALFPIKDGPAEIDPYTAKCTVIPVMDAFGGSFGGGKAYSFTKSSKPVKVNVKPLPIEDKPEDFAGAVGNFQVSARVEDKNVVEGQPFTLKVRFEGQGNAKLIDYPSFEIPQGLELYDKQNDARFFRTGTSYKDFSFLLIPRREGEFVIPSMGLSIFDPKEKKYVRRQTEPVRVIVGRGSGQQPGGAQSLTLEERAQKKKEISEPRLQLEYESASPINANLAGLGYVGIFGLIGFTLLWRARVELGWGQKKKDLLRQLRARLRKVEASAAKGDWRGVGTGMTNAVYFVLGNISGEGGANAELEKLLRKAPPSVRRELGDEFGRQMEIFQVLSFAPEDVVGALKDPANLKKAVADMERLMIKAVSLALSAGQSDESGSDQ
jgi:hypothetical protein